VEYIVMLLGTAVVSNLLKVTKMTGESSAIKDRIKTEPADACEATLPVEPL
jgi:hypothetical protein